MQTINIQFTLFSAFYSPLITTIASGLLQKEGLDPKWSVAAPGTTALDALKDGTAHVVQSALSQGFNANDNDDSPEIRHFAQVNEMDGFFLTARKRDADFDWKKLENSRVILFGGGQPLVMFKYGLQSDMARAFVRAYTGSRLYLNEKSASDVATMLHPYFTDIDLSVLKNCIESYQQLGCWTPHIEITDAAYNATLDIYQQSGGLETRYPYNDVCSLPPSA